MLFLGVIEVNWFSYYLVHRAIQSALGAFIETLTNAKIVKVLAEWKVLHLKGAQLTMSEMWSLKNVEIMETMFLPTETMIIYIGCFKL